MVSEAEKEAKQLDSVTDMVKETELDANKAQQAMSALSTTKQEDADGKATALAAISVSKDDVALIVSELDVSEDVAERALREVALAAGENGGAGATDDNKMVVAALRQLVTG